MATLLVALAAAAGLMLPLVGGSSVKPMPSLQSVEAMREAHRSRFFLEDHLIGEGKEPLAWSCAVGQGNRVRYIQSACFADHWMDIVLDLRGGTAAVSLSTKGEAIFLLPGGLRAPLRSTLAPAQANQLQSELLRDLSGLDPTDGADQMPAYLSAIEACIDGKAYLSIRRVRSDPKFESAAARIAQAVGVALSRKKSAACM